MQAGEKPKPEFGELGSDVYDTIPKLLKVCVFRGLDVYCMFTM